MLCLQALRRMMLLTTRMLSKQCKQFCMALHMYAFTDFQKRAGRHLQFTCAVL